MPWLGSVSSSVSGFVERQWFVVAVAAVLVGEHVEPEQWPAGDGAGDPVDDERGGGVDAGDRRRLGQFHRDGDDEEAVRELLYVQQDRLVAVGGQVSAGTRLSLGRVDGVVPACGVVLVMVHAEILVVREVGSRERGDGRWRRAHGSL